MLEQKNESRLFCLLKFLENPLDGQTHKGIEENGEEGIENRVNPRKDTL